MSDIPSFPYADLWEERQIRSVANLTREDAREFLRPRAARARAHDRDDLRARARRGCARRDPLRVRSRAPRSRAVRSRGWHHASNCSSGTAARRTRAHSPTCGPHWPTRARPGTRSTVIEIRDDADAAREHFTGSPTIRVDGRDVVPSTARAGAARLPRLPPPRRPHLPGPRPRRPARRPAPRALPLRRSHAMSLRIGAHAPAFDLPATDGDQPRRRRRTPTRRRPSSSSPATTARTRSPGTSGSPRSPATTPSTASSS